MLTDEEVAKIQQLNKLLRAICEKLVAAKTKIEAIITIEEASIHPKQALLKVAREAWALIAEEEAPGRLDIE
jgi:hypothetical protein